MAEEKKPGKPKERRPTAKKRDLQNEKRRLINRQFKASVKTAIRKFEDSLTEQNTAASQEALSAVYSAMDKGVKRKLFKPNMAGRLKSRLTAKMVKT